MSTQSSLMQPLRSDHLKPRPSTQAVWEPDQTLHTYEVPEVPIAAPAQLLTEEAPEEAVPEAMSPIAEAEEEASAGQKIASLLSQETGPEEDAAPAEEAPHGEESLSDLIASILSEADDDDDDDAPSARDALPNGSMPSPVCVPLDQEPAPRRKGGRWLWLAAALLAAGLFAAWHFGYLSISVNLP